MVYFNGILYSEREVNTLNIGNRIKKIRKEADLTQTEFASRIGSVQNSVTRYENNQRNPSSTVIALICREFNVREEWLRTGKGEMFKPKPTDALDQLAHKYQLSNADYAIIEKYLSLRPETRKEMFNYFREVSLALEGIDPNSPAYDGETAPRSMDDILDYQRKAKKLNTDYEKESSTPAASNNIHSLYDDVPDDPAELERLYGVSDDEEGDMDSNAG